LTPITFTTPGKFVILQGAAPANSSSGYPGGVCLNFTPSSGTAITFDIDAASIGSGNAMGAGMRDISLFGGNPICVTPGGCGGTAVGISTGTNGIGAGMFSNDRIAGFNQGFAITDKYGWGIMWLNTSIVWNATGIYYDPPAGHELDKFIGGVINANGYGARFALPGELSIVDASIDSNGTCGVQIDTAGDRSQLHTFGVHWENNPGTTYLPLYVCGGTTLGSTIDITGGEALDDNSCTSMACNNTTPWFLAGIVSAKGIILSSSGRNSTGSIFSANTALAGIDVINQNQAQLTPLVNNANAAVFTQAGTGGPKYIPELNSPKFVYPEESSAPMDIQVPGSDKCYGNFGPRHGVFCSFNGDGPYELQRVFAFGSQAMTTTAVGGASCSSAITVSAPGVLTTDTVEWSPSSAPIIGNQSLTLNAWPTTDNVNFAWCNPTAASITPSAQTINWKVAR
jgi:hypothetical protein